ncbi:MAG: SDR family oxidoreductase [Firmicutes bacterium]|jgi:NAD(P)-dependent dehydrogenase (short-subunit alcohol dehydrogenase family)|nr:SDR family oxidoreductase [Bacillota bacterium]
MLLQGKVTLATGGARGIRKAVCTAFARKGALVSIVDVDLPAALEVGKLVRESGHDPLVLQADQLREAVEQTAGTFGRLDVVVNSAGIAYNGNSVETDEDNWDRLLGVNLKGTWLCCKYAIPRTLEHGGGSIINLGSIASFVGLKNNAAYNASKRGMLVLTRNIAVDFAPAIRANVICPAMILTPMLEAYMDTVPDRPAYVRDVKPRLLWVGWGRPKRSPRLRSFSHRIPVPT